LFEELIMNLAPSKTLVGLPVTGAMLKGKRAAVTGSTSGIGLGIAHALAAQGADVLLNGFGEATHIERVRASLAEACGVRVAYSAADMSREDEIDGMIEQARRELGALDILVNNAGVQHTAQVQEFPTERWNAIIAINLSAAFHATKGVLPDMTERGWGRIINIASVHGLVASPQKSAYVAAKHGLLGLTKVVALELAATRITCNAICPGWVLTPLVQKQIDDLAVSDKLGEQAAAAKLLGDKQPSLSFVTPEQIGGLAVFLCSEAAAEIRGAAIPVDGGWTAQ
jgi:3-hydroxybutyrate dehydrogenase